MTRIIPNALALILPRLEATFSEAGRVRAANIAPDVIISAQE
jgi:hypothetical protein